MFFPTFIARALPWLRPTIFKAKCLRMVSINSEYLNLSMVEPAPENLAPWLLYWTWLADNNALNFYLQRRVS